MRVVNAYVNDEPNVVPVASGGEGSGRYVILELDTDYSEEGLTLKQTATLRTDHVIATPGVRLYTAEG